MFDFCPSVVDDIMNNGDLIKNSGDEQGFSSFTVIITVHVIDHHFMLLHDDSC